eukprot:TRINITY_DN32730_c0_g1_i1.p1 TRINITY_DN32730_c0_g1~~TRINITY_DN32730_c0_g1_i1.p1  ORF type:complete len:333 (+),score=61.98 TRINITY_DN32730_c0_g1_i1:41-1039(+)
MASEYAILAEVPVASWQTSDSLLLEQALVERGAGADDDTCAAIDDALTSLRKACSASPLSALHLAVSLLRHTTEKAPKFYAVDVLEEAVPGCVGVAVAEQRELLSRMEDMRRFLQDMPDAERMRWSGRFARVVAMLRGEPVPAAAGSRSMSSLTGPSASSNLFGRSASGLGCSSSSPSLSLAARLAPLAVVPVPPHVRNPSRRKAAPVSAAGLSPSDFFLTEPPPPPAPPPRSSRAAAASGAAQLQGGGGSGTFCGYKPKKRPETVYDRESVGSVGTDFASGRTSWRTARPQSFLIGQPIFSGSQFKVPSVADRPVGRRYFQEYQRCKPLSF